MERVRLAHGCFALAPNTLRRAVSYLFLRRLVNLVDYRIVDVRAEGAFDGFQVHLEAVRWVPYPRLRRLQCQRLASPVGLDHVDPLPCPHYGRLVR